MIKNLEQGGFRLYCVSKPQRTAHFEKILGQLKQTGTGSQDYC